MVNWNQGAGLGSPGCGGPALALAREEGASIPGEGQEVAWAPGLETVRDWRAGSRAGALEVAAAFLWGLALGYRRIRNSAFETRLVFTLLAFLCLFPFVLL